MTREPDSERIEAARHALLSEVVLLISETASVNRRNVARIS